MEILDKIPNLWPVISMLKIFVLPNESEQDLKDKKNNPNHTNNKLFTSRGLQNTATELIARHLRLSTYLILAMFAYYVLPYPSIQAGKMSRMHVLYWAPCLYLRSILCRLIFWRWCI